MIPVTQNKKLNVKASGMIALAVMCSRLLGLIREVLFNALFGTSSMGIFIIAFRAPNLLRDLFAEGALSISFITIFSKKIEQEGDVSAWKLASKMLTLTTIFMSMLSLMGVFYAKPLVAILAPGLSVQAAADTVFLTQIMYPFILLVSLAALVMGMLNAKNIFGIPALASSFFNIGSILGGVFFGWLLDPAFGKKALIGLAIGTLIGGLFQLIIQLPSLRSIGFRFKLDFNWRDAGIRQILILTWPAVIAASAVQINVLINTGFASYLGPDAVTWLNSAFRLMQLPIGLFGVAVATITLPVISRIAVAKDFGAFGSTINHAIRLAIFLTLPAAVGLWFFSYPIISLIYQHGKFVQIDAANTALALQFYSLGLVAYACVKVLSPAFYAVDKKWTPMLVSFVAIGLNIILNYSFVFVYKLGAHGLALSTSISAAFNFVILFIMLARHYDLHLLQLLSASCRCAIAAIGLAAFCWISLRYFNFYLFSPLIWIRGAALLVAIGCSALIYLVLALLLRVEVAADVWNGVRKKVK